MSYTGEKKREYMRVWRNKNRDKLKKYYTDWKNKNPENYAKKIKNRNLREYGINVDEFEALKQQQNDLCPICNYALDNGRQVDVDNCHITGMVRGILHNKCNRLLAFCEDSVERLESAIKYLRRHNA